jgi:hypothetical protein
MISLCFLIILPCAFLWVLWHAMDKQGLISHDDTIPVAIRGTWLDGEVLECNGSLDSKGIQVAPA